MEKSSKEINLTSDENNQSYYLFINSNLQENGYGPKPNRFIWPLFAKSSDSLKKNNL
jgi:hypothetical protein